MVSAYTPPSDVVRGHHTLPISFSANLPRNAVGCQIVTAGRCGSYPLLNFST